MSQKRLFLLDAYALIFRGYYAFIKNPRINSKGMDTSAIMGFMNSLMDVIKREKPDHLAVAFDKGGSDYRYEMYQEYKAHRDETPEAIKIAVPYIQELLRAMHIPIMEKAGFEADDLIGTLAKQAEKEGYKVYMVTPDKDFAQLVSENIFMYKPARMGNDIEIWGVPEVLEKFEIERPEQVIDFLGMMGDSADNIPGFPGVGEVTAKKLLKEFGTMENLLENTDKLKGALKDKNQVLIKVFNRKNIEVDEVLSEYLEYAEILRPYVADTVLLLDEALKAGKRVLLEGSQGTLLDVDHGTYPFVTSSNPTAGGACTGSGIGPTKIDRVIGIVKAYTTRVGSGPFPTELFDEDGEKLRTIGGEVGVTTGRARRCGWYDAPIARYAVRVNGLTDFFLTKLDVLTGWKEIPVCVAYEIDGKRVEELPASQSDFHHAKPIYENLPGWTEDISGARKISDLPKNAQDYIAFLEKISGAPMSAIGVGPGRDQTIVVKDFI